MADPISITASIVALATFAFQSSQALYNAVDSIKNNSRSVRELKDEAEALSSVLVSLTETVTNSDADFSALETPLRKCGELCNASAKVISKCSVHGGAGKFSWRDFLNSTYRGKTITELRSMIGAYKGTIAIALADANM